MSLLLALAATTALQAAPVPAAKPAMIHSYMGLSLSPDGNRIATFEAGKPGTPHMVITFRDTTGKVTGTADPCETCRYDSATWSPDGKSLAFLANDSKAGTVTLFVLENGPNDIKNARSVTSFKGIAGRPAWSPDGQTIALLATVNPHKLTGATQAGAAQVGEIGIAESIDEQRIAIVPVKGGDLKFVSPDDTFVYEYDWTADGSGFVATSAKGDGDNNWWTAQLVSYPLGGSAHQIAAPSVQMNDPTATRDGKSVLFIGGLMSDFGSVGGDVYIAPIGGGEPVNLTKDAKVTFTNLTLTKSGLIAGIITGGESGLAKVDIVKGGYTILSHSEVSTAGISLDASGTKAAAVMQSYTQAPAIAFGSVTSLKAITHDNDGFTVPFTAKSVSWTNDGFTVQGWLLVPNNLDPKKTYPMVTIVHGGPAAAYTPRFAPGGTTFDLLKAGYFVFQPNPRGSYGQGEAFTQANKRDFGGGDLRDILTGIDAVEKVAPVDDKRLGIYGHSYGGLMTMWTVTQTTRFKAGVAGAGIANWSSYYGENGIDQWMIPYFGASFYDDPAIYDKLSPIRYIKNAKTPTFIYVGERDVECPAPQSQEFWHGLKEAGVETSLVIYEGEGHGIRDPKHTKDLSDRIANWFGKYLGQP